MSEVSFDQWSIFMARISVLQEMMETLLMKEIEEGTEIGQHWLGRAETAKKLLESEEAWKPIRKRLHGKANPDWVDPSRRAFEETVWIVEQAVLLAQSAPKDPKGKRSD